MITNSFECVKTFNNKARSFPINRPFSLLIGNWCNKLLVDSNYDI